MGYYGEEGGKRGGGGRGGVGGGVKGYTALLSILPWLLVQALVFAHLLRLIYISPREGWDLLYYILLLRLGLRLRL